MFLHFRGKSENKIDTREYQLQSPIGKATCWEASQSGEIELSILFEGRTDSYIDPAAFSRVGQLASFSKSLPNWKLERPYRLTITPVPTEWSDACDVILPFLGRFGFKGTLKGLTLHIENGPEPLLKAAGILLLALDPMTASTLPRTFLDDCRHEALGLFPENVEELLELLDLERGAYNLRRLLNALPVTPKHKARETEIKKTLRQLQVKDLVYFNCGNGRFLRDLASALDLDSIAGVEPSLTKLASAARRDDLPGDILHGSVTEPPCAISPLSTALLVEALPRPSNRGRLERAAEMLFEKLAFEWILIVEGEAWRSEDLVRWGKESCSKFGYQSRSWTVAGTDTAVLFRRNARQAAREHMATAREALIETPIRKRILIYPVQWNGTLEAFSKHTVDPRWLFYLPPALCSIQSDRADGYLEHPRDAFDYYRGEKIGTVVVEYKHMGSRAIAIVCRDEDAAKKRFGDSECGCIYTRNGRPFFEDSSPFLGELREGLTRAGFWEKIQNGLGMP